jgi:hypothetical protein
MRLCGVVVMLGSSRVSFLRHFSAPLRLSSLAFSEGNRETPLVVVELLRNCYNYGAVENSSEGGPLKSLAVTSSRKETHMKTKYGIVTSVAFSAVFLVTLAAMPNARAGMNANGAEVVTNGPQANPHDNSGSSSTRQNVRDSRRYEAVVHSNSGYRASRVKKECGPIADPQLHASCVASFK